MKPKYILIPLLIILLASLLSGCVSGSAYIASSWPGMTADTETIYVAYGAHIYAINLKSGVEKWQYPTKADRTKSFYAAPVLTSDGQLIVSGFDHKIYSLDPATGTEKWVYDKARDRYIAGPLVTTTGIYAPNADGSLYALDFNGQPKWVFKTSSAIWATPSSDESCGCIIVSSMDHHVYAINAESGAQVWKSENLDGAISGTPAIDAQNQAIYVGTFGAEMFALNAENGTIIWRQPTQAWVWGGPAIKDNVLYFGDQEGYFYALSATDGTQRWRVQPQPNSPIISTPTISSDQIYFTTEASMIYAVDKDGTITWSQNIAAKLYTAPLVVGDQVLVAEDQGQALLVSLNKSGGQQWIFTPPK